MVCGAYRRLLKGDQRVGDLTGFYERIARCQADYHERPIFICFFGDSNTRGWGNGSIQYRDAYPTRLLEALHDYYPGCTFNGINSGIAGNTLTQALGRIERDVLRYEPDLVIIAFGLNDSMAGQEHLPQFRASLRTAIQTIRARSAVVLLTPNMMATRTNDLVPVPYREAIYDFIRVQTNGILDEYVNAVRITARDLSVPLADTYRTWQQMAASGIDTTRLLANGINHPYGYAHRLFADALLACISGNASGMLVQGSPPE